jgi:hypothetical protein
MTSTSPTKKNQAVSSMFKRQGGAEDIEAREGLTEQKVAYSHDRTTEYLITQHREVVDNLRKDNAALREEN